MADLTAAPGPPGTNKTIHYQFSLSESISESGLQLPSRSSGALENEYRGFTDTPSEV